MQNNTFLEAPFIPTWCNTEPEDQLWPSQLCRLSCYGFAYIFVVSSEVSGSTSKYNLHHNPYSKRDVKNLLKQTERGHLILSYCARTSCSRIHSLFHLTYLISLQIRCYYSRVSKLYLIEPSSAVSTQSVHSCRCSRLHLQLNFWQ